MGCYNDRSSDLNNYFYSGSSVSVFSCVDLCANQGYSFAGLLDSEKCRCGNSFGTNGIETNDNKCNKDCKGNSSQICGSSNSLSVYETLKGNKIRLAY